MRSRVEMDRHRVTYTEPLLLLATAGALVSHRVPFPKRKGTTRPALRLSSVPNKRPSPPMMTMMASRRKRAVDVSIRGTVVRNRIPITSDRSGQPLPLFVRPWVRRHWMVRPELPVGPEPVAGFTRLTPAGASGYGGTG